MSAIDPGGSLFLGLVLAGAGLAAAAICFVAMRVLRRAARRRLRRTLGVAVPAQAIATLSRTKSAPGEAREVSVMIIRVRDMAGLRATYQGAPEVLSELVARVLGAAGEIALSRGGTVGKHGADRIIALWNAPVPTQRAAHKAGDAALRIVSRMVAINDAIERSFAERSLAVSAVEISIGIATGEAIVGDFAVLGLPDYSAIGLPVERALALQSASEIFGQPVIVDAATEALIGHSNALLELDLAPDGEGGEPKPIFALLGNPVLKASPAFRDLDLAFQAFYAAFRAGDDAAALRLLEACAANPGAHPRHVAVYRRRLGTG